MKRKNAIRIGVGTAFAALSILLSGGAGAKAAEGNLEINETSFPDAVFRSYVSESIDTDHDGFLSQEEIGAVTEISVAEKDISSLEGIGFFTELKVLDCKWTDVKSLDVSQNAALELLNCYETDLESLNVSGNPNLKTLICGVNELTSLDVSGNPELETLSCEWNDITNLDLSNNTALTGLNCENNKLTVLDLGENTALEILNCSHNELTNLDLSRNTALESLDCSGTNLTALDLQKNEALTTLECNACDLTALDLSNQPMLKELQCSESGLEMLDVSKAVALEILDCNSNELTALDVSNNTALRQLFCQSNQLTALDVKANTELIGLNCSENQLASLDLSNNELIYGLNCSENQLISLDVSKNPGLLHVIEVGAVDTFYDAIEYVAENTEEQQRVLIADKTVKILGTKYLDIADCTLSLPETDYTYTIEDIEPQPTVVYQGNTLTYGTDYTLAYRNNYYAGTATVVVKGAGDYRGVNEIKFTISRRNIAEAKISSIPAEVYKGSTIKPKAILTFDGEKLYEGFDYSIRYSKNVNIGTATIKITGMGNYTGTVTKTFRIIPKASSVKTLTAGKKSFTVKWAKVSIGKTTGYQIQYGTNKSFKAGTYKYSTIKSNATIKQTLSKLVSGKTYYVRVRTFKTVDGKNVYSAWSDVKSVKVK